MERFNTFSREEVGVHDQLQPETALVGLFKDSPKLGAKLSF